MKVAALATFGEQVKTTFGSCPKRRTQWKRHDFFLLYSNTWEYNNNNVYRSLALRATVSQFIAIKIWILSLFCRYFRIECLPLVANSTSTTRFRWRSENWAAKSIACVLARNSRCFLQCSDLVSVNLLLTDLWRHRGERCSARRWRMCMEMRCKQPVADWNQSATCGPSINLRGSFCHWWTFYLRLLHSCADRPAKEHIQSSRLNDTSAPIARSHTHGARARLSGSEIEVAVCFRSRQSESRRLRGIETNRNDKQQNDDEEEDEYVVFVNSDGDCN